MRFLIWVALLAGVTHAQAIVEFSPTLKRALVGTTQCTMSLHTPAPNMVQVWCYFGIGSIPADLPKNTVQHVDALNSEQGSFAFPTGCITWIVTPNATDPTKMDWKFAVSRIGGAELTKQGTS